ncbi:serine hydrolase domain-containing protein [Streptococcus macacae]|uniref:Beta-lactamase n=1 Tax=Streptococcus macacae NCTC 11558 TaxID=764298 RepID=G5JU10_9STRE|nr:serine hydrolase domain-containing protein [Streptococcus macacae]EHJ52465.1 beta-lactamase [Streptococcus macacae NCTC 11558]SUN78377.1 penicillin-binding protein, class C [Streptococcus macacae NCTC 11558]
MRVRKFYLRFLIFLLIFLGILYKCAEPARIDSNTVSDPNLPLLKRFLTTNQLNGVMIVTGPDGKAQVFSNQSKIDGSPVSDRSYFPIASLQKLITGVAIQQLIDEQKLSLQTPLSRYYPQIENSDNITIQDLLCHTSGLSDLKEVSQKVLKTQEQQLDFALANYRVTYQKTWKYANTNYALLAGIISQISGQSYEDYVRQHFLTARKNWQFKKYIKIKDQSHLAALAKSNPKAIWNKISKEATSTFGAGDYAARPMDYWNFMTAFVNNQFVPVREYRQSMQASLSHYYGGLYVSKKRLHANGGGFGPYSCFVYSNIKTKQVMVLFVTNGKYKHVKSLAAKAYKIYERSYSLPKNGPLN